MRCATVMLKMLKIRNEPTSSVTPPNTSSTIVKNERSDLMSSDWRAAASWPVSTWTCGGSARSIRALSWRAETPSTADAWMPSSLPRLSVTRCASGSVSAAVLAPPESVSPSRCSPTIL